MNDFNLGGVVALRRPDGAACRPYLVLIALVRERYARSRLCKCIAHFRTSQRGVPTILLIVASVLITSCATPDTRHRIVVSIPEQRLALLDNGALVATYPISTS